MHKIMYCKRAIGLYSGIFKEHAIEKFTAECNSEKKIKKWSVFNKVIKLSS